MENTVLKVYKQRDSLCDVYEHTSCVMCNNVMYDVNMSAIIIPAVIMI